MTVPATAALLAAWEDAQQTDPRDRPLRVLRTMCAGPEDPADLPSGMLNHLLLQARALLFGDTCDAVAECPSCGAQLEATLSLGAVLAGTPSAGPGEATIGGIRIAYRAPSWRELRAVSDRDVDAAAAELLAGCVTAIHHDGRQLCFADLDSPTREAIDELIGRADPGALITVSMTCPDCAGNSELPLDPAPFLWTALDRWAMATLCEVSDLAATYGWSEQAILAMTPWRRRAYLSLAAPSGEAAP